MVDFIIINAIASSVYMYNDRIEVVSYGGLPCSLSIEGFFFGTGVPVNKSLLTIFMVAKYAEQSGHGVPTIVEKYGRRAFSFDNGMIKVTIPLAFEREEKLTTIDYYTLPRFALFCIFLKIYVGLPGFYRLSKPKQNTAKHGILGGINL